MKIGFIGLGNMGGPMAQNLVDAGHEVTGFDVMTKAVPPVAAAETVAEAVKGAEVVITMLPNGKILNEVYAEIAPMADQGAVLLDCSTVDVAEARQAAELAVSNGAMAVDAPVSGGIGGATNGTLTFMVGGSEEAVAKVAPLLEVMGQKTVHCGNSGAGQAAKICNNMLLGISMLGVCEAFSLADKLGLPREKFFDVASTSSGYCWSLNAYCPAPGVGPQTPADNDYQPGFAAELMLKDLGLSQSSAQAAGALTRMGALATEIYQEFVENGGRGQDFSAYLKKLSEG